MTIFLTNNQLRIIIFFNFLFVYSNSVKYLKFTILDDPNLNFLSTFEHLEHHLPLLYDKRLTLSYTREENVLLGVVLPNPLCFSMEL